VIVEAGSVLRGIVLDSAHIPRTDVKAFARALAAARPKPRPLFLSEFTVANDDGLVSQELRIRRGQLTIFRCRINPNSICRWIAPIGGSFAWGAGLSFDTTMRFTATIHDNSWNSWALVDGSVISLFTSGADDALLTISDLWADRDALVMPTVDEIIEITYRRGIALTGGIPRV
jgi:hypothetical protein